MTVPEVGLHTGESLPEPVLIQASMLLDRLAGSGSPVVLMALFDTVELVHATTRGLSLSPGQLQAVVDDAGWQALQQAGLGTAGLSRTMVAAIRALTWVAGPMQIILLYPTSGAVRTIIHIGA